MGALIEIAIFSGNEWYGLEVIQASDVGASMFVHIFGAYFGLMVSLVLKRDFTSEKERSSCGCSGPVSIPDWPREMLSIELSSTRTTLWLLAASFLSPCRPWSARRTNSTWFTFRTRRWLAEWPSERLLT